MKPIEKTFVHSFDRMLNRATANALRDHDSKAWDEIRLWQDFVKIGDVDEQITRRAFLTEVIHKNYYKKLTKK